MHTIGLKCGSFAKGRSEGVEMEGREGGRESVGVAFGYLRLARGRGHLW